MEKDFDRWNVIKKNLDSRRLTRKIKTIEQNLFEKIIESLKNII